MPLHECEEEVDPVSALELRAQLRAERWLVVGVGEECRLRQGSARSDEAAVLLARRRGPGECEELSRVTERWRLLGQAREHGVDDLQTLPLVFGRLEKTRELLRDVPGEDMRLLRGVDVGDQGLKPGESSEPRLQLAGDQ